MSNKPRTRATATSSGGRREIPAPRKAEAATPGNLPTITTARSQGIGIGERPARKQRASSGKKGKRKAMRKNQSPALAASSSARAKVSFATNLSTSGRPNFLARTMAKAEPSAVPNIL